MAIKHIVTMGFGFADGTAFIPTLGFTPNTGIAGPFDVQATQAFMPGAVAAESYSAGSSKAGVFQPGTKAGDSDT